MKLSEWLKIQGAQDEDLCGRQYPGEKALDYTKASFLLSSLCNESNNDISFYSTLQLYRLIDGELKRIDKPLIKYFKRCPACKKELDVEYKAEERRALGCLITEEETRSLCPDCQQKMQKKQEKIKIKPCRKCGSKNLHGFIEHSNSKNERKFIICMDCRTIKYLPYWNDDVNYEDTYTNITNQLEVEGDD